MINFKIVILFFIVLLTSSCSEGTSQDAVVPSTTNKILTKKVCESMGGGKPVKWSFVDFNGIIFNNVEACSLWTMPHKVSLNKSQSNIDNTTLITGQSGSAWILFSPNVGITNINLAGSTEYGFQESSVVPYISHTNEDSYLVESLNLFMIES